MFAVPYTLSGLKIYPASKADQQRIHRYCSELNLPLETIDFASSRIKDATDIGIPSDNLFPSDEFHLGLNKDESGEADKRYVPVFIKANKDWNLDRLVTLQSQAQKENFVDAKWGKKATRGFIFSKYFKIPGRVNDFLALLTNRPDSATIQQLKLPSYMEPLVTEEGELTLPTRY